jgi:glycosyltransferase involved in cell wall biosynthesis
VHSSPARTLVAVVAYNEALNLERVLGELREHAAHDVVVIDNGSTDATREIAARAGVACVSHCVNTGSSMGTVKTYFHYAYEFGYDVVCQFDGDGQHAASGIARVMAPVLAGEADYVIGSRFLERRGYQSSATRRLGIRLFSGLASRLVGTPVSDVTSGFRAYGRRVIELFARHYPHELYDTSQLLLLAHYAGARIAEVPVEMRPRESGRSEFDVVRASFYPLLGILDIAAILMQRKQLLRMRRSLD